MALTVYETKHLAILINYFILSMRISHLKLFNPKKVAAITIIEKDEAGNLPRRPYGLVSIPSYMLNLLIKSTHVTFGV